MPTSTQAPPLPPRQFPVEPPPDHDEPPPAYTPSPAHDTPVLEVGPRYPFGATQSIPNSAPQHFHNPYNPPCPAPHPTQIQNYPNPPLPQSVPQLQTQPIHQQPSWNPPPNSQYSQNYFTPTAPTEPTTFPTPGRPLLFEDKTLVYPYVNGVCYFCPKCCNTGFKGFDATRPCRKCWLKYGKPWQVVRLSPMTSASMANLQRPLPPTGFGNHQPPPLVVRPGDPRIGGRLCLNCNGSGAKQEEINLFNVFLGGGGSEVCISCRGTGRIF